MKVTRQPSMFETRKCPACGLSWCIDNGMMSKHPIVIPPIGLAKAIESKWAVLRAEILGSEMAADVMVRNTRKMKALNWLTRQFTIMCEGSESEGFK